MTKMAKRLGTLIVALVMCLSTSIVAFAVDFEKEDGLTVTTGGIEGIRVTTTTDKKTYVNGDKIQYTVTIENTSDKDIADVSLKYTLSGGHAKLRKDSNEVSLIKAGEKKSFTIWTTSITAEGTEESGKGKLLPFIIIGAVAVIAVVIAVIIIIKTKNKKKLGKGVISSILIIAMLSGSLVFSAVDVKAAEDDEKLFFHKVSVHDPSIFKDPATGKYYVFGSHRAWAVSDDLMDWKTFSTNINSNYSKIFSDIWYNYCYTDTNKKVDGNCWAPDIIYNETMGKYCMYMSINGDDWHSAVVLLTADAVTGPYTYVDEVVFSGQVGSASGSSETMTITASKNIKAGETNIDFKARITFGEKTLTENRFEYSDMDEVLGVDKLPSRYTNTDDARINAIDPCVTYDEEGNLWMTYGSWSAGIFQLKLDKNTGLRDYSYTYDTKRHVSDQYLGYKIAGGCYNSGEGPYILHAGDYYYLFISYGNLEASGGYNMRVFRSESINGPFVDMNGKSAILTSWLASIGFNGNNTTNKYNPVIGLKIFGSYRMYGVADVQVAQGHNSAFVDDDGKIYLVYHTRYANGGEGHNVRVHQMFINEDGWLVAAPYEYSGETLPEAGYSKKDVTGTYEFVFHDPKKVYANVGNGDNGIINSVKITLNSNGTITGEKTGKWSMSGSNVTMTIDNVEYKGVFIKQANELSSRDQTMTFTVTGGNYTAWGVMNPADN